MYSRIRTGDPSNAIGDEQIENSQQFLGRERRMLFLRSVVTGVPNRFDQFSVPVIMDDIIAMNVEDPEAPIYLVVDSGGGEIPCGNMMFDLIRLSKAPIITIAQNVASMATLISAAGTERLAFPHSQFMLHLPEAVLAGDSVELEIKGAVIKQTLTELINSYVECGVTAGLTTAKGKRPAKARVAKQIREDIQRPFWLTTKSAIEYGLVDRVVSEDELFGEEGIGYGDEDTDGI